MTTPGMASISRMCVFIRCVCVFNVQGSVKGWKPLRMTLYSVSSCNRMNITVGWTSCGETNSRESARRSKPWRTSTGFCWRMSCLRTWPSTFWAATGKMRWAPRFGISFSFLLPSPSADVMTSPHTWFSLLLEHTFHSCSSLLLSRAADLWVHSLPLFPLFLHLFHSLNPMTFSLLPLSEMIKHSSYVSLGSVSPFSS